MVSDQKAQTKAAQTAADDEGAPVASLTPAARRALDEAAQRREQRLADENSKREIGGRGGKDPARYGDWEVKGIAVDF
ncbi:DUF1674 domain-containing protein [Oricola cellulosilytica]|uniref:DUF1674 domain-containing protein n=1 Tax=Oricola cellulosilytica TaxID=1429082 RepID=A0A4R0P9L1_9HYPH|nr:DUF1674 domain-containing protein [Oricola cellulosilytica]TCD13849.1 DUF1674 domain-containing protein [Oricola cellulosilytica]